ncbi:metallophosphoesterase [Polyangium mundeleinium]|uniref:Metallophosphoesterase n=1 Tax=Polyangium mundeleinium TaxID=2995306 RepID=A0ABT5F818_9BACT|nr:metallophosphoesterase [Polyangium mundeleinium]MDC0749647.1 metallophosphoesterase [Polyangium mundeleinium]
MDRDDVAFFAGTLPGATTAVELSPLVERLLPGNEGARELEVLSDELVSAWAQREGFDPQAHYVVEAHPTHSEAYSVSLFEADAVRHWSTPELVKLLRLVPALFARYYPESAEARALLPGYDGFDFHAFGRLYREKIARAFEHVSLLGFPPDALRQKDARGDIRLADLFVPTRFITDDRDQKKPTLAGLLQYGSSALILGDPGMGKTTLLAFLSLLHSDPGVTLEGYRPSQRRIPFFASLREYAIEIHKNELTLVDFLAARARSDHSLPNAHPAFFEATLRMGEALVLLDGLDEVGASTTRSRVAKAVREFRAAYPRCPVWVTSRIHGYTADIALPRNEFEHLRIGPLADEDIAHFIKRWYRIQIRENDRLRESQQSSLRRAVFRTSQVRALAANPLLLTLMAFVHRFLGHLPQERGELYEKCVDMLLRTWLDAKERPEKHAFERRGLPTELPRAYLEKLALHVQSRAPEDAYSVRGLFSRDDALDFLTQLHRERAEDEERALSHEAAHAEMRDFIDFACDRVGLLVDRGGGKISFLHLTLQEYLAAYAGSFDVDDDDEGQFVRRHLGDGAWEEVLLLRWFVLAKKRGERRRKLVRDLLGEIVDALAKTPEHPGWLTLGRAIRDGLVSRERDRRVILSVILSRWAQKPAFSGDIFVVLDDICEFGDSDLRAELRAACADLQEKGTAAEALAALHLEGKLLGDLPGAAERIRARPDLAELLPDLVVFRDEPALGTLLDERSTVDHWATALAALGGTAVYRTTLGWLTGLSESPVPSEAPFLGAARWLRDRSRAEISSRFAYTEHYPERVHFLLQSPYGWRLSDWTHTLTAPLAFRTIPSALAALPQPAPITTTLRHPKLARDRMGNADLIEAPIIERMVRFNQDALATFPQGEPIPEDTVHHIAVAFVRTVVRTFAWSFPRSFTGNPKPTFVREFVQSLGRDLRSDILRSFGRAFAQNFLRDFFRSLGRAFLRSFGPALGRDFVRDLVPAPERRRYASVLGNAEASASALDWEALWDQALGEEAHVARVLEQDDFWWLIYIHRPRLGIHAEARLPNLTFELKNPLALPVLLADVGSIAANEWLFALSRHLHVQQSDEKSSDEAWETWLDQNPIDAFWVAFAWDEHAKLIRQHHGRLDGPLGALALAHADYASLMTGFDLVAACPTWKSLLDEAGAEKVAALRVLGSMPAPAAAAAPVSAPAAASASAPASVSASAPAPEAAPLFTWLHLSDLHFGLPGAGDRHNQSQILSILRDDLSTLARQHLPRPDAILVTGDIAWSGKPDQYAEASKWLLDVAQRLGLTPDRIFVVPGNHDVDRSIDADRNVKRLLRGLRGGDDDLDDALDNPDDLDLLRRRQAAYLAFAASFAPACRDLFWSSTETLREGLSLRLIGANTSLLAAGDDDARKLRLGQRQRALLNDAARERELVLVLGHHPLEDDWLAEQRDLARFLGSRAHAYLAGHVHDAKSERIVTGGGADALRIIAGAVYGGRERDIPHGHAYSVTSIHRAPSGGAVLRVHPRRFSFKNYDFRLDIDSTDEGRSYAEHPLARWSLPPAGPRFVS